MNFSVVYDEVNCFSVGDLSSIIVTSDKRDETLTVLTEKREFVPFLLPGSSYLGFLRPEGARYHRRSGEGAIKRKRSPSALYRLSEALIWLNLNSIATSKRQF